MESKLFFASIFAKTDGHSPHCRKFKVKGDLFYHCDLDRRSPLLCFKSLYTAQSVDYRSLQFLVCRFAIFELICCIAGFTAIKLIESTHFTVLRFLDFTKKRVDQMG